MDINDPRNPNNVNRPSDLPASPATREGTIGFMWPIIAVIAALIAGVLFLPHAHRPADHPGRPER